MTASTPLVLSIGAAPVGWEPPATFKGLSGFPCTAVVANAGRALHMLLNKDEIAALKKKAVAEGASSPGAKTTDFAALASMSNKEDFYQMLGLQNLRFRATQTDIKKAYRQCVLKYHPDKMAQQKEDLDESQDVVLAGVSDEQKAKELKDIPKAVLEVIEKLMDTGKSDQQILNNFQMQEFIEGNDVCPKGLENPDEKISRVRKVREGLTSLETEADQAFKALSNAMSTLSDPQKRRAYDSKELAKDIDDSIPADKKPADDDAFFQIWRPVLDRNARWAVSQPMPGLGDKGTPIEDVLDMYDKWFNFESWRDFTLDLEDAFDLDEASCREERRWMERQNKKNAEKLQKDETRRINDMIERCHKWDPRILEYKEQLKNAKKAGKQAKYAERAAAEEAAKRRAEEEAEAQKKIEEENAEKRKAEKEQKEVAKKELRRARKALRDAGAAAKLDGVCGVKIDDICGACTIEDTSPISMQQLLALAERVCKISGGNTEALPILEREVALIKGQTPPEPPPPEPAAPSALLSQLSKAEQKGNTDRKWSRDETDTLHKALLRYPAGTQERWERIAEFMTTRSAAECQRKCAEMKSNFAASANGMTADAQLEFERAKKHAAEGHGSRSGAGKKVSGTSINADREISREGITYAVPKGADDNAAPAERTAPNTVPAPAPAAAAGGKPAAKPVEKPCAYGPASSKKLIGTKPKHAALSSSAAKKDEDEWAAAFSGEHDDDAKPPPPDPPEPAKDPNEWTAEQQRALEAAMQEFKNAAMEPKEKWKAIAEKVPDRTDKECIKRVKEIKALLAATSAKASA